MQVAAVRLAEVLHQLMHGPRGQVADLLDAEVAQAGLRFRPDTDQGANGQWRQERRLAAGRHDAHVIVRGLWPLPRPSWPPGASPTRRKRSRGQLRRARAGAGSKQARSKTVLAPVERGLVDRTLLEQWRLGRSTSIRRLRVGAVDVVARGHVDDLDAVSAAMRPAIAQLMPLPMPIERATPLAVVTTPRG